MPTVLDDGWQTADPHVAEQIRVEAARPHGSPINMSETVPKARTPRAPVLAGHSESHIDVDLPEGPTYSCGTSGRTSSTMNLDTVFSALSVSPKRWCCSTGRTAGR